MFSILLVIRVALLQGHSNNSGFSHTLNVCIVVIEIAKDVVRVLSCVEEAGFVDIEVSWLMEHQLGRVTGKKQAR